MKIILKTDVDKLGKKNEMKEVTIGYARNYLIPKGLALEATDANMLVLKQENDKIEKKRKDELEKINKIIQKLSKISVNITVKVGEGEKIFGAVTKEDVIEGIDREVGMRFDKQDVLLDEPIHNTGVYLVQVKLKTENFPANQPKMAEVKIWVIGEK